MESGRPKWKSVKRRDDVDRLSGDSNQSAHRQRTQSAVFDGVHRLRLCTNLVLAPGALAQWGMV